MERGSVPSRLASLTEPPSSLVQYTWLPSAATPKGASWPATMVCGLLPSRLACQISPAPAADPWAAVQKRLPELTATPNGSNCPVTMACGLLPSRLACQIAPAPAELSPVVLQ